MSWDNLKLSTGKKTLDHVHSNDHPSSQKTLLEWDHPLTTERETWRIEGSTAHNDSNACTWCIWKPWPTIEVIRMRPERTTQDFLIWMDVLQVCTAMGLWCAKWTKKFQEPRDSRSLACETRFFLYMKLGPGDCSLAHYALEWPWNWAWNEATVIYSSYSKLIRIQWRSHKSVCCEWLNDLTYIYTIFYFSCRSRFGSNLWATVASLLCSYPAHIVEVVKAFFFCLMLLRSTRLLRSRGSSVIGWEKHSVPKLAIFIGEKSWLSMIIHDYPC